MGWMENPGCSTADLGQLNYQRTVEQLVPQNLRRFFPPVKCEPNTFYPPRCFFPMPAENLDTFLPPYFQFPTHLVQDNLVMNKLEISGTGDWTVEELNAAMTLVDFAKIHERREKHERQKEQQRIRRRQRLLKKRQEKLEKIREIELEKLYRQQMLLQTKPEPVHFGYPVPMEVDSPEIPISISTVSPRVHSIPANHPANTSCHPAFPHLLPLNMNLPDNLHMKIPRTFSKMLPPVITPVPSQSFSPEITPHSPPVILPATPDPPLFIHIKQEIKQELLQEDTSSASPPEPEQVQNFVEQLLEGKFTVDFYSKLFS